MNASSDKHSATLARLDTKRIRCLLETLLHATLRRKQFLEATYKQHATSFREAVQFLTAIGWARAKGDEVRLTNDGEEACESLHDETETNRRILAAMVADSSPYRLLLANYVLQFKCAQGKLTDRRPVSHRLQASPIRNLLMDMRIVSYERGVDAYFLSGDGVELHLWATNFKRRGTREQMDADAKRREKLGISAELAVFKHEKSRVGARWASRVEHISAAIPSACYDIKSVTVEGDKAEPRYIEVKAVSVESFEFYWTASEVEVAGLLGSKYFLYLVPVLAEGKFDLSRMLVICNPHTSVYQNPQVWLLEENVIVCRRKPQLQ